jgi:hypothetical protein
MVEKLNTVAKNATHHLQLGKLYTSIKSRIIHTSVLRLS